MTIDILLRESFARAIDRSLGALTRLRRLTSSHDDLRDGEAGCGVNAKCGEESRAIALCPKVLRRYQGGRSMERQKLEEVEV